MTIATTTIRTTPKARQTGLLATISHWPARRAQRRALMAMEPHRLDDLGLTRTEARIEASKPFWKA